MSHWTNPRYRLHIDMLRTQATVFKSIWQRMIRENRKIEARSLSIELEYLNEVIDTKEGRRV